MITSYKGILLGVGIVLMQGCGSSTYQEENKGALNVDVSHIIMNSNNQARRLFSYDLGLKIIQSASKTDQVTICCHGYGDSNQIVDGMYAQRVLPGTLVGFNFPDHDITGEHDHTTTTFGSIDEIVPLLFVLRVCLDELQARVVNLYGFSAGGGTIVNCLAVLNTDQYDKQLASLGITEKEKKKMVIALERGHIILDCPLKSIEEIIAARGSDAVLEILRARYDAHHMNPIDAIQHLAGMRLSIILHFQKHDEIVSNRDDQLFIERIRAANQGTTSVVIGDDGGHNCWHASLWNWYQHQRVHDVTR